ncbi:MAG: TolB family protein [Phycisphaerales bacterium]
MVTGLLVALTVAASNPAASSSQPATSAWAADEAPFLTRHVQLTFPDRFVRAGEQYFDHQSPPKWVVFQAIERPAAGVEPDTHYAMFAAELARDADGRVTGLGEAIRLSPPGSANTCGWFHPTSPGTVIFGSTITPPESTDSPGYSRDRQRYSWQFPREMEVVSVSGVGSPATKPASPTALFSRPGYDAECSYSADGRFLLYTHVDPTTNDPNIWVYDTRTDRHHALVTARGYDGGPFFSPDGKWITYRSDRRGNNVLQLYVAELAFGNDGDPAVPIGVLREIQLTSEAPGRPEREQAVSWCPYFHPSGKYVVYATSEVGHHNYEVFALEIDADKPADQLRRSRVTHAAGFDGLPTFSADGSLMMWTSQRGAKREGEERPSSQMWLAEVVGEPAWTAGK